MMIVITLMYSPMIYPYFIRRREKDEDKSHHSGPQRACRKIDKDLCQTLRAYTDECRINNVKLADWAWGESAYLELASAPTSEGNRVIVDSHLWSLPAIVGGTIA